MSRELRRRLEAVEARSPSSEGLTVFRTFCRPGEHGPIDLEPVAITCGGRRWDRESGEALDAFRRRVAAEVPRSAWGVAALMDVLPPE